MRNLISFCKNNMLEILFLIGAFVILVGYYACFTLSSTYGTRILCSACAFIAEPVGIALLCLCAAKRLEQIEKLLMLNLTLVICLVVLCLKLSSPYVTTDAMIFVIMVGVVIFLFDWVVFAAIAKFKKVLPEE